MIFEEINKDINKEILDDLEKPKKIKNNLEILQSQLPSILDDFQKYYVFFNKNPEYSEYQQIFQNIKSNLNNINSKLFKISNDVEIHTDKINKKLFVMNILIEKEKKKIEN